MRLLYTIGLFIYVATAAQITEVGLSAVSQAEPQPSQVAPVSSQAAPVLEDRSVANNDSLIYPLSEQRRQLLSEYATINNIWRFFSLFVSALALILILLLGLSARFRDWSTIVRSSFIRTWLYFIFFGISYYLLTWPFKFYRGFVVEHRFGFSNQTFLEYLSDDLLSLLLLLIIGAFSVWGFYRLVNSSRTWWLKFSVISLPFIIFFVVVSPVFISPLFNDFKSLEDGPLRSEILLLAEKAGIGDADIFQVNASKQSTKVNAYVTGLWSTERIVLYDNLIQNFSTEELKFVMGHEIGHYVENHIWFGVAITVLLMTGSLWLIDKTIHRVITRFKHRLRFDRLGDIASLPLVLLFSLLLSFLVKPIGSTLGRQMEHRSDLYGMNISGTSKESATIAFEKLSAHNLSDPDPNPIIEFWFYSHPSIAKRIKFVQEYKR